MIRAATATPKRAPPAPPASGYTVSIQVLLRAGPGPEQVTVVAPGIAQAIRVAPRAFPRSDPVVVPPLDQTYFFNPTGLPPGLYGHDATRST